MKKLFFSLLVFFFSFLGYSQIGPNDDAVYLDSLDNIGNENNFKRIRVVKDFNLQKDLYDVIFFYRSGKIEMRGTTKNKFLMAYEGTCIYYYENGNRKKIENYYDKELRGKQFEWYENGNIKLESEVVFDKKTKSNTTKIIHYWNSNNEQKVIDGEGDFEDTEELKKIGIDEFSSKSIGKIKNYLKEGFWTGKSTNPEFDFFEQYENGKLISGKRIDSSGVEVIYDEIFQKPKPKKGMGDFYNFIGKNYNTPQVAGLQGKIFSVFIVNNDGKVSNIKIIKDVGYGTGAEAIRVISKYDQWIPGYYRGVPVGVLFTLPITIQSRY